MQRRTLHFVAVMRLVLALIVPGGVGTAWADTTGCELCIENSPVSAGKVSPNTGTHRFTPNSVVTLSAEPEPGYEFAYWIGDVSSPKSKSTTVQLNTSKIVVAVFEPAYDESVEKDLVATGGGGGSGGGRGRNSSLVPMRVDLRSPEFTISGGGGGVKTVPVAVPVVVTPEPSTFLLLGLGSVAIRRRRRQSLHAKP